MKINEILKEENVGKRFKFSDNGKIYIVEKVSNKSFELFDGNDEYLTDSVYLSEILNGDFKEMQTYKLTRIEYELFKSLKRCCGYCHNCGICDSCDDIENIIKNKLHIIQLGEVDEECIEIID